MRQSKDLFAVQRSLVLVICICNTASSSLERIALIPASGIISCKEQPAVLSDSSSVTVGHIHQVIFTTQRNDIPHVRPFTCTAGHRACDRITRQSAQITEVLERLGISLADNICRVIAVKYIDQLPRVAITARVTLSCSSGIIIDQITDRISKSNHLRIIRVSSVLLCNSAGRFGCTCRCTCLLRVYCLHLRVSRGPPVLCADCKSKGDRTDAPSAIGETRTVTHAHPLCFVIPV